MGDVEALSTNELIEVICSALGKKGHIWNIPRGLMNGFAKIKAALGMKEMPVRAKDGLTEKIRSFAGK